MTLQKAPLRVLLAACHGTGTVCPFMIDGRAAGAGFWCSGEIAPEVPPGVILAGGVGCIVALAEGAV